MKMILLEVFVEKGSWPLLKVGKYTNARMHLVPFKSHLATFHHRTFYSCDNLDKSEAVHLERNASPA